MERPASIAALAALVPQHARLRLRSGGTKPGLSAPADDVATIDLRGLSGLVEYTPEECTFTALAGTPLRDIEAALAPHGQHLPFDPPLVAAGATIGGTVAAGINGSCRYRFGGIRDFIIGARFVDGRGRVLQSGGKVVKNAAGFLLHQALVGSCGTLGVLAELTFKIFPAAEAHATIRVRRDTLPEALALMTALQHTRVDLEALDLEPPATVVLRLGGFREGLGPRVDALLTAVAAHADVLLDEADATVWREAREFAWAPPGDALVRVPVTPGAIARLERDVQALDSHRRYAVGGHVALIATAADQLAPLHGRLVAAGLTGQVLRGPSATPFIGAVALNAVEARLRTVLDPDGRFAQPLPAATE